MEKDGQDKEKCIQELRDELLNNAANLNDAIANKKEMEKHLEIELKKISLVWEEKKNLEKRLQTVKESLNNEIRTRMQLAIQVV